MQILLMTVGLAVPIVANHYYLNDLSPYGIDLGPVSMSISFILHGIALFSFQMFNLAPIARDTVFESLKEGVIVLNKNGAIVDYNQAMLPVMPDLKQSAIGKHIHDVLYGNSTLRKVIYSGKKWGLCVGKRGRTGPFPSTIFTRLFPEQRPHWTNYLFG